MIDRLVFGCGRLTGGAGLREAEALIKVCLEHGIRRFDCAPSYGMGTAEAVLGKALRHRSDCRIVTKLGTVRDPYGFAKIWLRGIRRALRRGEVRNTENFIPLCAPPQPHGRWDAAFLRQSVEISAQRLLRIDALYLHDPHADVMNDELLALAEELAGQYGAKPGIALSATWPEGLAKPVPPHWDIQAAFSPDWLKRPAGTAFPSVATFHSVMMTAQWLARREPAFGRKLKRAGTFFGDDMAGVFALAALAAPGANIIFASSNCRRLQSFLRSIRKFEDAASKSEFEGIFDQSESDPNVFE